MYCTKPVWHWLNMAPLAVHRPSASNRIVLHLHAMHALVTPRGSAAVSVDSDRSHERM